MIYQDLEETEYEYKRAAKMQRTMKKTMHLYSSYIHLYDMPDVT